jgi:hypothetical protein
MQDDRIIAALVRENIELKAKVERLEENERRQARWLRQAKDDAGIDENVSFDHVWEQALAALKREQAKKE